MAGLMIASFLCLFTGFEGPFAFFGKEIGILRIFILGVICLLMTIFLNYLVDFQKQPEKVTGKIE